MFICWQNRWFFSLPFLKKIAVQHERAPRGALKRSFQPEADTIQTHATSMLPLNHPPPLTSLNAGYPFYPGNFAFPWRPALGLHHVPRHFALNFLAPPSLPLVSDDRPVVNRVKEDEVSSSAVEEQPAYKRSDLSEIFSEMKFQKNKRMGREIWIVQFELQRRLATRRLLLQVRHRLQCRQRQSLNWARHSTIWQAEMLITMMLMKPLPVCSSWQFDGHAPFLHFLM